MGPVSAPIPLLVTALRIKTRPRNSWSNRAPLGALFPAGGLSIQQPDSGIHREVLRHQINGVEVLHRRQRRVFVAINEPTNLIDLPIRDRCFPVIKRVHAAMLIRPELFDLTQKFIDRDPMQTWGLYVAANDDSPGAQCGREIERIVFQSAFGYTPTLIEEEYGPYEDQTIWMLIVDHRTGMTVASSRLILGPPQTLKFADDLERFWNTTWEDLAHADGLMAHSNYLDVATNSVLEEWRKVDRRWPMKLVSISLHMVGQILGISRSLQVVDPLYLRLLRSVCGVHIEPFNLDPVDFHGLLQPAYADLTSYRHVRDQTLSSVWQQDPATASPVRTPALRERQRIVEVARNAGLVSVSTGLNEASAAAQVRRTGGLRQLDAARAGHHGAS